MSEDANVTRARRPRDQKKQRKFKIEIEREKIEKEKKGEKIYTWQAADIACLRGGDFERSSRGP